MWRGEGEGGVRERDRVEIWYGMFTGVTVSDFES